MIQAVNAFEDQRSCKGSKACSNLGQADFLKMHSTRLPNRALAAKPSPIPSGGRVLRPLLPSAPKQSRDCGPITRPPVLAATHPAAYDLRRKKGRSGQNHYQPSTPLSKTAELRMGLLTPPPSLPPLPHGPLFPGDAVDHKAAAASSGADYRRRSARVDLASLVCSDPADPMRQTSSMPPDWNGRVGVLRSDMMSEHGNVLSVTRMTGLPMGGMVEIAEYYGSPSC